MKVTSAEQMTIKVSNVQGNNLETTEYFKNKSNKNKNKYNMLKEVLECC